MNKVYEYHRNSRCPMVFALAAGRSVILSITYIGISKPFQIAGILQPIPKPICNAFNLPIRQGRMQSERLKVNRTITEVVRPIRTLPGPRDKKTSPNKTHRQDKDN